MLNVEIIVSGKVQGVGYRYFTQMMAVQFHITGWVRNRDDGSVEIHASGSKENLEMFIAKIQRGNPFSAVQKVSVHEIECAEHFNSFAIKY